MSLPAIKQDLERARCQRFTLRVRLRDMLPQHGEFQIYGEKLATTLDNLAVAYRAARVMALMQSREGELDFATLRDIFCKIKNATH